MTLLRGHFRVRAVWRLTLIIALCHCGQLRAGWQLIWSDEFNGASLDASKWTNDVGNGFYIGTNYIPGWGNNELEYYTSRTQNLWVSNGLLHIYARQEPYAGFAYTSARLNTAGLFTVKYGRIQFCAKLPQGVGYWPALWLMPENAVYGTWPASGEIDVMENKGSVASTIFGTLHYGAVGNDVYKPQAYVFRLNDGVTNFHVYQLDWSTNAITWSVDGVPYQTLTNWFTPGGPYPAPFDQPFYLLMNLSVGGNYLGNPSTNNINDNTSFPGDEQVDYVRVYKAVPGPDQAPKLALSIEHGMVVVSGSNGFANAPYNLIATTDLAQPLTSWFKTDSGMFNAAGNCTNTISFGATTVYYRLSVP